MVVLSTSTERQQLALDDNGPSGKRGRRNGADKAVHLKGV
jgi:hypothetical protein